VRGCDVDGEHGGVVEERARDGGEGSQASPRLWL